MGTAPHLSLHARSTSSVIICQQALRPAARLWTTRRVSGWSWPSAQRPALAGQGVLHRLLAPPAQLLTRHATSVPQHNGPAQVFNRLTAGHPIPVHHQTQLASHHITAMATPAAPHHLTDRHVASTGRCPRRRAGRRTPHRRSGNSARLPSMRGELGVRSGLVCDLISGGGRR
jgi:hypothetical protein